MLDLYENNRHIASISFSEMLDEFGVRCFWDIQNMLNRKIVFVRSDSTVNSTLRTDGGRVDGQQHHSRTAPEPNQTAAVGGEESKVHPAKAKDSLAGAPPGGRARTHA